MTNPHSPTRQYFKYHALGSDYLVLDPGMQQFLPTPDLIKTICDNHFDISER